MRVASPIPHKKARIEIIPLIDIMFFLLASFMMVSLSQVHMKGINVNLPSGVSGEVQTKREYVSVSVDKNGHYFFDKDEVADEELLNRLKMAHQSASGRQGFSPPERGPPAGPCSRGWLLQDFLRN
jgi:biopolymer transport protein ExbD